MSAKIEIIPARVLFNTKTRDELSIFSVIPYGPREDWVILKKGYTFENIDIRGNMTTGPGVYPTPEAALERANELKKTRKNLTVVPYDLNRWSELEKKWLHS